MTIIPLQDSATMLYDASIVHLLKNMEVYKQIAACHKNGKLKHNVLDKC